MKKKDESETLNIKITVTSATLRLMSPGASVTLNKRLYMCICIHVCTLGSQVQRLIILTEFVHPFYCYNL